MTLHLFDGIAVVRRDLERDVTGRVPRRLFTEMLTLRKGDVAVWCWDGKGAKLWRQKIYPAYKAKRLPQPDSVWATINLVRDLLKHTAAIQVQVPEYEADDLIAHYAGHACAKVPVKIHSVDKDLSALMTNGYVTASFELIKGVQPRWVGLYKLCVGDTSDNIGGIPGFGKVTWETISARQCGLDDLERIIDLHMKGEGYPSHTGSPRSAAVWDLIPKRCQRWLELTPEDLVRMKQVISFRELKEVPAVIVGKPNVDAGNALLKEFMQ